MTLKHLSFCLIDAKKTLWLRAKARHSLLCVASQRQSQRISQVLIFWLAAATTSLQHKHLVKYWIWNNKGKQMNQTRNHPTERKLPTSEQHRGRLEMIPLPHLFSLPVNVKIIAIHGPYGFKVFSLLNYFKYFTTRDAVTSV